MHKLMKLTEASSLRAEPLDFEIGDTVDVHTRILEGTKERIQVFNGTVIARRGDGTREMFTVRRIVAGEGVERTFPVNSPKIAKLNVVRHGRVPQSQAILSSKSSGQSHTVGRTTRVSEAVRCDGST